jgi:thiamine-phosphate pyrophosphorylase
MVGRSCHSRAELDRAAAEGCRWATLSPIFVPTSKPGYGPALGAGAVAGAPLPVWALGGIGPDNAGDCLRAGASGVAVMGAILRAEDPADAVAAIQERLR